MEKSKHADFLLKMTKFPNIIVKIYLHKSLIINKGVVRNKELDCTIKEIKRELKKNKVGLKWKV